MANRGTGKVIGKVVGRVLSIDPQAVINVYPLSDGRLKLVFLCSSVRLRNEICEEFESEEKVKVKRPLLGNPKVFVDRYGATLFFDRFEKKEFVPASPFELGDRSGVRRGRDVRRHEEDVARSVRGERHVASGALPGLKSDASGMYWQAEAKLTSHRSMALKLDWLDKISREARQQDKLPALFVRFNDVPEGIVCDVDWVVIQTVVFDKMDQLFHG